MVRLLLALDGGGVRMPLVVGIGKRSRVVPPVEGAIGASAQGVVVQRPARLGQRHGLRAQRLLSLRRDGLLTWTI